MRGLFFIVFTNIWIFAFWGYFISGLISGKQVLPKGRGSISGYKSYSSISALLMNMACIFITSFLSLGWYLYCKDNSLFSGNIVLIILENLISMMIGIFLGRFVYVDMIRGHYSSEK